MPRTACACSNFAKCATDEFVSGPRGQVVLIPPTRACRRDERTSLWGGGPKASRVAKLDPAPDFRRRAK